jgi:hypothetical protein
LKRRLALILLSTVFLSPMSSAPSSLVNGETAGWQVDVYTQKQPFSGKGIGQPSDAFAPDSLVVLFANVTYNMFPVQNKLVTFAVTGPPNAKENITLILTNTTNADGIAQTDFRLPHPNQDPETITFGPWTVQASIENASDSLTFRVGWLLDVNLFGTVQIDPPQGGRLEFQVSIKNIAMTPENTTLEIFAFDSRLNKIGSIVLENLSVKVNFTNLTEILQIPRSAAVGTANATTILLTAGGTTFSPPKSITFQITLLGDLNFDGRVDIADIAIVAAAFGSYPGHPRWNPLADVNKDRRIDIMDIALVAHNFGKHI